MTRKIFTESDNKNTAAKVENTTIAKNEEKQPFIIFDSLSKEINDSVAHVMNNYVYESLNNPSIYNGRTGRNIQLSMPYEYEDALFENAKIISDNIGASIEQGFIIAKDDMENMHHIFNTNYDEENIKPGKGLVIVDNFIDSITPSILKNLDAVNDNENIESYPDEIINLIAEAIRHKLYNGVRNIITSFIISYNNDITRAVECYISNSTDPVNVFPDLITLSSNDIRTSEYRVVGSLLELFRYIIYNESSNSLKDNIETYYGRADMLINKSLMEMYDITENSVLSNFIDYMNNHIAELDSTVAHDIQLILIDRLPCEVFMLKNQIYALFNNIMTDINIYWLPSIDEYNSIKKDGDKKRRNYNNRIYNSDF